MGTLCPRFAGVSSKELFHRESGMLPLGDFQEHRGIHTNTDGMPVSATPGETEQKNRDENELLHLNLLGKAVPCQSTMIGYLLIYNILI